MNFIDDLDRKLHQPKLIDFYTMFNGLSFLLNSGANLQQALLELAPEQRNKYLSVSMRNVARALGAGVAVGNAFRRENIYPNIIAPTLEAGDKAGNIAMACKKLADILYLQHNLGNKVKGALFTPKIAMFMLGTMIIGYVKFAIPEYMELYKENEIEIPGLITIVTSVVNTLVDYFYITIPLVILGYYVAKVILRNNKETVDLCRLHIPIYKELHYTLLQYQFTSMMELMLFNGLTVPESLGHASGAVSNSLYSLTLRKAASAVRSGKSLTESLRRSNEYSCVDSITITAIKAGEASGELAKVLANARKYYSNTLNDMIDAVSTKLTFVVMIPMGALIVALFMFTLIPMFSYISQVTTK